MGRSFEGTTGKADPIEVMKESVRPDLVVPRCRMCKLDAVAWVYHTASKNNLKRWIAYTTSQTLVSDSLATIQIIEMKMRQHLKNSMT